MASFWCIWNLGVLFSREFLSLEEEIGQSLEVPHVQLTYKSMLTSDATCLYIHDPTLNSISNFQVNLLGPPNFTKILLFFSFSDASYT